MEERRVWNLCERSLKEQSRAKQKMLSFFSMSLLRHLAMQQQQQQQQPSTMMVGWLVGWLLKEARRCHLHKSYSLFIHPSSASRRQHVWSIMNMNPGWVHPAVVSWSTCQVQVSQMCLRNGSSSIAYRRIANDGAACCKQRARERQRIQ